MRRLLLKRGEILQDHDCVFHLPDAKSNFQNQLIVHVLASKGVTVRKS